ncbi:hypothetical protein M3J09_010203 [Ascochyta lentis]
MPSLPRLRWPRYVSEWVGTRFHKDGHIYLINFHLQHAAQAT